MRATGGLRLTHTSSTKQPVNLTLNVDVVRRAKALVGARNLSATVDGLLETFVAESEAAKIGRKAQIELWCALTNEFVARYGAPGDEYSPF